LLLLLPPDAAGLCLSQPDPSTALLCQPFPAKLAFLSLSSPCSCLIEPHPRAFAAWLWSFLQGIFWRTVIIDEAHRMKSTASSTRAVIANMDIQWLLLLTGVNVFAGRAG
jgi:hypothetical protein